MSPVVSLQRQLHLPALDKGPRRIRDLVQQQVHLLTLRVDLHTALVWQDGAVQPGEVPSVCSLLANSPDLQTCLLDERSYLRGSAIITA